MPYLQAPRKEKLLLPWKVGGWIITRKTLIFKGRWVGGWVFYTKTMKATGRSGKKMEPCNLLSLESPYALQTGMNLGGKWYNLNACLIICIQLMRVTKGDANKTLVPVH